MSGGLHPCLAANSCLWPQHALSAPLPAYPTGLTEDWVGPSLQDPQLLADTGASLLRLLCCAPTRNLCAAGCCCCWRPAAGVGCPLPFPYHPIICTPLQACTTSFRDRAAPWQTCW